jgi:hypothetical protein
MMLNRIFVLVGTAFLMSACGQPDPVASAPPPPPSAAKQFMVFFDFNSSTVSGRARDTLKQAAAAQKESGAGVTATGHADRSGSDAYNMALSVRRANAVRDALVREGVPAASITTAGRGESQPLVPTADGVREPQNRRVEIAVGQQVASGDFAYCREMSARYRRYLGQASTEGDVAKAMYDCESGNTAAGIPILEKALRDAKLTLPPRT